MWYHFLESLTQSKEPAKVGKSEAGTGGIL